MATAHAYCGSYSVWYGSGETVYVTNGAKLILDEEKLSPTERTIMGEKFSEAMKEIKAPLNAHVEAAMKRGLSAYEGVMDFRNRKGE
jgi:hypothetical protein